MALKPGEHVVTMWPDSMTNSIMIGVEGDESTDLPEVPPGMQAPRIDRSYARIRFRDRLIDLIGRVSDGNLAVEGRREAYLRDLGELVESEIFPSLNIASPPGPTVP